MKNYAAPVSLLVILAALLLVAHGTPLDDYVNKDDGAFAYNYTGVSYKGLGYVAHMYNMTSQIWLTPKDTNIHTWWHYIAIIIPDQLDRTAEKSHALLYITGSCNDNSMPTADGGSIEQIGIVAASLKSPAAVLWQVPNCPLESYVDPFRESRVEDAAIALTWWYFMRNPTKPEWILELPMTKAGVKALDLMQAVIPQYNGGVNVTGFLVAGASKRGWTTWLVGAVDKRVVAIVPMVLDALHFLDFSHRQFRFYGAWSFALSDYYKMNFTQDIDMPNAKLLASIVDPYFYLHRLTMPKLAVNAGGDEFQMPDDQRHWGHHAPGEMHFAMIKNAEHSLATGLPEVIQTIAAFAGAVFRNIPRPEIQWEIEASTGAITINCNQIPLSVDIAYGESGQGVSAGRRDFRWAAINATPCPRKIFGACIRPLMWNTTTNNRDLIQLNATAWRALVPTPAVGWRAFFIEVQFWNPVDPLLDPFLFTSPASVVPLTEPFPDCHGSGCKGTLC